MLHNENEGQNEKEARNMNENIVVDLKREVYANILSLIQSPSYPGDLCKTYRSRRVYQPDRLADVGNALQKSDGICTEGVHC